MRKNLQSYVREYGSKTFEQVPFHDVDALALAQLSYLKMDGIIGESGFFMTLHEMVHTERSDHLFSDKVYGKMYRDLYGYMGDSPRYKDIKIGYFKEHIDETEEIQFAAVSCMIDEERLLVAYRGTDEKLVGWKEDLNMSYMKFIPSQNLALNYLMTIGACTDAKLVLAGHSKGGNLAIYASACAPEHIQNRIRKIYSFDGPGFSKNFYKQKGFQNITAKISKIIPCESIIGSGYLGTVHTEDGPSTRIIRGYNHGVSQHDLMKWKILKGRFVSAGKMSKLRIQKVLRLNNLIETMSPEQLKRTIDILYEILTNVGVKDVYELTKKTNILIKEFRKTLKTLEKEEQQHIYHVAKTVIFAL